MNEAPSIVLAAGITGATWYFTHRGLFLESPWILKWCNGPQIIIIYRIWKYFQWFIQGIGGPILGTPILRQIHIGEICRPEIDKGRSYKLPVETFWKYPKRWCTKDHEKRMALSFKGIVYIIVLEPNDDVTILPLFTDLNIIDDSGPQNYHFRTLQTDFWKTEVTFISLTVYAWNTKSDVTGMGSSLVHAFKKAKDVIDVVLNLSWVTGNLIKKTLNITWSISKVCHVECGWFVLMNCPFPTTGECRCKHMQHDQIKWTYHWQLFLGTASRGWLASVRCTASHMVVRLGRVGKSWSPNRPVSG